MPLPPSEKKVFKHETHPLLFHLNTSSQTVNMYPVPATRPHTCTLCDQSFIRRYNLERHRNTVHSDYTEYHELEEEPEMEESVQSDHSSETDTEQSDMETDEENDEEGEESSSDNPNSKKIQRFKNGIANLWTKPKI